MSILQIHLFGSVRMSFSPPPGPEVRMTRTIQALFAYLLLHRQRVHPRDSLAGLFWGEQPQEKARASLNTALWRLRSILEPSGIPAGTFLISNPVGDVGVNRHAPYWLDTADFELELTRTLAQPFEAANDADIVRIEAALQLYEGDLLEGYYYDWALHERERLRWMFLNGLAYLMILHRSHGRLEKCLSFGKRILDIDPLREEIHREIMRGYLSAGQRAQAIAQYEHCRQALFAELGVAPMEETQALYHQALENPAESDAWRVPGAEQFSTAIENLHQAALAVSILQTQLWSAIESIETAFKNGWRH